MAVSGRWVGHGQALLLLGPPGVGKRTLAVALGAKRSSGATVLFNSAVGHLFFQLDVATLPSVLISSNLPVGATFQKRLKGSAGRIQVERVCY